jgi:hypothetical protein
LRLRVGAWLAVPRTTSSRSDTTPDPTPGARRAAVLAREMAGPASGLSEEPAAIDMAPERGANYFDLKKGWS